MVALPCLITVSDYYYFLIPAGPLCPADPTVLGLVGLSSHSVSPQTRGPPSPAAPSLPAFDPTFERVLCSAQPEPVPRIRIGSTRDGGLVPAPSCSKPSTTAQPCLSFAECFSEHRSVVRLLSGNRRGSKAVRSTDGEVLARGRSSVEIWGNDASVLPRMNLKGAARQAQGTPWRRG